MSDLRDTLAPKDWPDAGTPEFWEQFGCEGSNEYRDCDAMSADYARLRRLERRVEELAASFEESIDWSDGRSNYGDNEAYAACARDVRDALKEPDGD